MNRTPVELGDPQDVVETSGLVEQGCILHDDGGLSCWGLNHHLQFGGALERNAETAVPVRLPHVQDAVALASGHHHICVLTDRATVACWGEPYSTSLGPDVWQSEKPVEFDLPDAVIVDVSASLEQVCAVGDSGRAWCWGQLGPRTGELADISGTPIRIPIEADLMSGTAGWLGACTIDTEGAAWCWGAPVGGDRPEKLDIGRVSAIELATDGVCALRAADGGVWCSEAVPDEVAAEVGFSHVAVSYGQTCAMHRDGRLACWTPEALTWRSVQGAL